MEMSIDANTSTENQYNTKNHENMQGSYHNETQSNYIQGRVWTNSTNFNTKVSLAGSTSFYPFYKCFTASFL